jgi:hypothetical protein
MTLKGQCAGDFEKGKNGGDCPKYYGHFEKSSSKISKTISMGIDKGGPSLSGT